MSKKSKIMELALFGGDKLFEETLHVGRPNIPSKDRLFKYFNDIFERRWLTNAGPYVLDFEKRLADYLGVKHCIAICNGTIALEIAIRAMDLKGEVILPSFTFIACAHALQWQEITPVFADIDPQTHNLDPASVEKMITPRTSAIMGVHLWGRPCNTQALEELAGKFNLKLFYDASHAFGCSQYGKMIGSFGNAEVFSFHATKFFNTFEGGAIATNDDALARKIRLMKNFGFTGYDKVNFIGMNGKMNELSAAMGIASIQEIDSFIEVNKINYDAYRKELDGVPGLKMIQFNEREKNNYQYIACETDKHTTGISRDNLIDILWAENIRARRYFYPGIHRMEPYISYFPHNSLLLPNTERLCDRVFTLPTGTSVTNKFIAEIGGLIRFVIENSGEINKRLDVNEA